MSVTSHVAVCAAGCSQNNFNRRQIRAVFVYISACDGFLGATSTSEETGRGPGCFDASVATGQRPFHLRRLRW